MEPESKAITLSLEPLRARPVLLMVRTEACDHSIGNGFDLPPGWERCVR